MFEKGEYWNDMRLLSEILPPPMKMDPAEEYNELARQKYELNQLLFSKGSPFAIRKEEYDKNILPWVNEDKEKGMPNEKRKEQEKQLFEVAFVWDDEFLHHAYVMATDPQAAQTKATMDYSIEFEKRQLDTDRLRVFVRPF